MTESINKSEDLRKSFHLHDTVFKSNLTIVIKLKFGKNA